MNWSMTTWAPLAKSPNCASQITKVLGSEAVAVFEAQHRLRQHRIDDAERRLLVGNAGQRHNGA